MGIERDRVRLAACVRLLHMEGLLTYNGHVSVRIPDANRFLIHSLVDSRAEVSPEPYCWRISTAGFWRLSRDVDYLASSRSTVRSIGLVPT